MARQWTEEELQIALGLYCKLPFGKLDQRNPLIKQVAEQLDRTPSSVAMKLLNLASLDPVITSSGRRGLAAASALDKKVWQEFSDNSSHWMPIIEARLATLLQGEQAPADGSAVEDGTQDYRSDNVAVTSTRREGQNLFREAVFTAYGSCCCVTGVSEPRLLIASHIKPWSEDPENRLNPRNGLCLSALVDRAFDKGLVSFSDDYRLLISPALSPQRDNAHIRETFYAREGSPIVMPEKFMPERDFLAWHRTHIFAA